MSICSGHIMIRIQYRGSFLFCSFFCHLIDCLRAKQRSFTDQQHIFCLLPSGSFRLLLQLSGCKNRESACALTHQTLQSRTARSGCRKQPYCHFHWMLCYCFFLSFQFFFICHMPFQPCLIGNFSGQNGFSSRPADCLTHTVSFQICDSFIQFFLQI